jgi:N-acetylmuramoyl-L-alanine amidase
MRKFIISSFLSVLAIICQGQKIIKYTDYPALARYNLSYLDKTGGISPFVKIGEHVFELKNPNGGKELFIPWINMGDVIERLETGDHHEMYDSYAKTLKLLNGKIKSNTIEYHPIPTEFSEMTVAIDPGHFASSFEQAVTEQKYVKIKGEDLGQSKDARFYEAFLTDATGILLGMELEKLGAKVVFTKEFGKTSIGRTFHQWYTDNKDGFRTDLQKSLNAGDIDRNYANSQLKGDSVGVFNTFFSRFVELRKRIDKINSVNPSLTIVIHYNAKENGKRDSLGYLKPVKENYSMAFVPGAFLGHELKRPSEILDFLRLLLSSDIDKSMRLAHLILQEEQNTMGIAPVQSKDHVLDNKFCSPTPYEGVYSRNLAMTRAVRGPVVYLEALLQDNENEARLLSVNDLEIDHPTLGKIRVPSRCAVVAKVIAKGIEKWLEENKSFLMAYKSGSK